MNSTGKKLKLRIQHPSKTPIKPAPAKTKKMKKKAEVVEPPKPYSIPGLPREEGPTATKTPNGVLGIDKGHHTVVMDTGTSWYVWQLVESQAHADQQKDASSMVNVARVTEQSVRAFREASGIKTSAEGKRIPKRKLKGKVSA